MSCVLEGGCVGDCCKIDRILISEKEGKQLQKTQNGNKYAFASGYCEMTHPGKEYCGFFQEEAMRCSLGKDGRPKMCRDFSCGNYPPSARKAWGIEK